MIFRYDNAPHWEEISTYPYHKHLPDSVISSKIMTLDKVLEEIQQYIESN